MTSQLNQMKAQVGIKVAASSPPAPPHIRAYSEVLGKLKADLRARGVKGDALVNHHQVAGMTAELDRMKVQAGVKAPPQSFPPLPPHIQSVRDQLSSLKAQFKAMGLTGKQQSQHPDVIRLQSQFDQMMLLAGLRTEKHVPGPCQTTQPYHGLRTPASVTLPTSRHSGVQVPSGAAAFSTPVVTTPSFVGTSPSIASRPYSSISQVVTIPSFGGMSPSIVSHPQSASPMYRALPVTVMSSPYAPSSGYPSVSAPVVLASRSMMR